MTKMQTTKTTHFSDLEIMSVSSFEIVLVNSGSVKGDRHFVIPEVPLEEVDSIPEKCILFVPVGRPGALEKINMNLNLL